jgi:hypothetical protein
MSAASSSSAALLAPASGVDHADFRPGSIKKLELTNFMTHAFVELRPSSAVNFVLGANGSGKSSLVCALCLGLGGDVRDMERGKELKAYIMTGKTEATIKVRRPSPCAQLTPRRGHRRRRRPTALCGQGPFSPPAASPLPSIFLARAQTLLTGRPADGGDWEVVRTLKTSGSNSWRINGTDMAHDGACERKWRRAAFRSSRIVRLRRPPPASCLRVLLARLPSPRARAQTRCAFCVRKCPSRWTTSACFCRRSA